jgi:hypothetical protein
MIHFCEIACARILCDQSGPCDRKTGHNGNKEKIDRKTYRNGSNRIRPKPTDPKSIRQLIGNLEQVYTDNGDSERYQGTSDRSFFHLAPPLRQKNQSSNQKTCTDNSICLQ